jgi:hypothetical protein
MNIGGVLMKKEETAAKMTHEHMNQKDCCSCGCNMQVGGWILLLVAILFLIRDLTNFAMWNIGGWTILFFIFAFWMLTKKCC